MAKVFNVSANGTKHLGQSYDGGGRVIYQDVLELDRLYIQAKRLSADTWVSAQQVREFIGSLDKHHTNKGVFVTTADFSAPARGKKQLKLAKISL
ncbi:MAG: restriction endonuclease [Rhodospirillaceae bacterium]|nr:restriction endonuclease [Rhodospirillaceae bacterium]